MRLLTAFAVISATVLGASALEAQTTLRFAHTQPPTDTHHLAAVFFADRLKEITNGEIEVTIHPAGELGSDPALLEGVRLGTIDIAQTGNPYYTRFEPRLNVLDLPYLFDDYEHVYSVIDGEVGQELLAGLEDNGMKGIAFWEIGFRKMTNSVRPIRTPGDLEGLKIRTTPNPAHVQAFKMWGAIPTPMAFTEVYLALETGTVDGQENPLNVIRSNRFQEVQDHLSFTDHAFTVSIDSMNLNRFNGLPEKHQQAILTAGREAAVYQRKLNREQAAEDLAAIEKAGVEVIQDIDKQAFKSIVFEPVMTTYVEEHGSEIVDAIIAAGE